MEQPSLAAPSSVDGLQAAQLSAIVGVAAAEAGHAVAVSAAPRRRPQQDACGSPQPCSPADSQASSDPDGAPGSTCMSVKQPHAAGSTREPATPVAPPASCDEVGAPAGADESAPHMPATTAAHPPGTAAADTPASDGVAPGSPGAQQLQQQLEEALGRAAAAEREQHEWQSLYQSEAAEAAQLSRRYDHLVRYVTAALTQRHQQQRVRQAAGGAPRLHCIREEGAAGGQAPAPRPPEGQAGAAAARRPSHKLSAHARAPRALPQAANGTAPALPAAPPAGKPHPKRSPPPPPLRSLAARHTASVPSLLPPSFPYGGGSPGMDSEFEERLRRGLAMSPGVRGSAASAGAASSSGGGRAQRSAPPPAASMSSSGSESDISSDASSSSGSAGSSFAPHMPDASGAATAPAAAGAASSDLATRSNSASATVAAVAAALGSNDLLVLERQLSAGLGSLINMLDPGILDAAHIGGGRPRRSRGRRSAEGKSKDSDAATQAARTGGSALAADAGDAAAASGGAAAAAAGDEDSGNPGSASNLEDEDGEGRGHWAQLPPATRQPRSPWELSIHGPADAVCALAGVPPEIKRELRANWQQMHAAAAAAAQQQDTTWWTVAQDLGSYMYGKAESLVMSSSEWSTGKKASVALGASVAAAGVVYWMMPRRRKPRPRRW